MRDIRPVPQPKQRPEVSESLRPLPPKPAPVTNRSNNFRASPVRRVAPVRLGHRERKIALVLLVLVAVVGVLAAFIFWPKAHVNLILRTAPLLVDEQLTIRSQAGDASSLAGSAFFREVEVTGESATRSTEVVGVKARGSVLLVNRTVTEQKIKEQSRLVTKDDTLFYMLQSANIPPSGSVSVEVEAAEAGTQGNIEPQRLNFAALDASAQSLVYAEAKAAISGGSGETVAVVKEADLNAARADAGSKARNQVEQEIRDELPKGWTILDESWNMEATQFNTQVAVDTRQPTIPYTARVTVRVMGYEQEALEQKLKTALEARLDQDYMLFPGPIAYSKTIKAVNWEQGEATISARVTHTTIPRFSIETLRDKLAGRGEEEAKTYLAGLPGVRSVELELSPFWARTIPRIEKRIILDLQPERQP